MPADGKVHIMKINEIKKKDGSTVYRANVYLGIDVVTGKKVTTKVTARTKKELKTKAQEAQFDFKANGSTRYKEVTIETYEALATSWWDNYKNTVKVNTRKLQKSILDKHLLPLFGSFKLDKLTTPLIQSIMNKLANRTNTGEVGAYLHYDKIHALNKRILQYGVVLQVIPTNPASNVVLPRNTQKDKKAKVKHFNNDELKQFLTYLDSLDNTKYNTYYDITLYKFLLATGCRINEALALSWSDIDLDNSVVHITKTLNCEMKLNSPKSKSSYRDIDIDQQTVTMLKKYQRKQTQEAWKLGRTETVVFSNFIKAYPRINQLTKRLRAHFDKAGVNNIGFHGFRHTHASLLLNSGIPYKELQHRLGHSKLSMTMDTYSHLSKENAKKATSFFEQALKSI